MSPGAHFSEAALLAFEIADLDDLREDIEHLADLLYALSEEAQLPSYFGKVAAEYRAEQARRGTWTQTRRRRSAA